MSWQDLVLWGTALVALVMFALWLLHLPLHNASIVDIGWAFATGALGVGYAVFGAAGGTRAIVLGLIAGIWGIRLATHLYLRIVGHEEEGRYQELRRKWGTNVSLKFLAFFQLQALSCVLLSTPFLLAAVNPATELAPLEWAGVALWVVSLVGESVADAQLAAFKADPSMRGKTCRRGLWRYSRHPNYFFEWLIWVAFALFATASPWGWLGWIAPALILLFLLRVTGIPATEEQAVRSRGEEYREYQRTTSPFVPWFPKEAA